MNWNATYNVSFKCNGNEESFKIPCSSPNNLEPCEITAFLKNAAVCELNKMGVACDIYDIEDFSFSES